MRINFLIIAHKNPDQIKRLINTILKNNNFSYIYIHFDSKFKVSKEGIQSINPERIFILPTSISCKLDNWSLVEATFNLIEYAYSTTPKIPTYYYLISGQDYPIKPLKDLHSYLKTKYPLPFIDCTPYSEENWLYYKYRTPIHNWANKISKKFIRKMTHGILYSLKPILKHFFLSKQFKRKGVAIYGGSSWWCLPDIMIEEIINDIRHNNWIRKLLMKTYTPEETVFQTLVMRTNFASQVSINPIERFTQNCLTYANFHVPGKSFKGHPYTITVHDLSRILTRDEFFARKFDYDIDASVLDVIDSKINSLPIGCV